MCLTSIFTGVIDELVRPATNRRLVANERRLLIHLFSVAVLLLLGFVDDADLGANLFRFFRSQLRFNVLGERLQFLRDTCQIQANQRDASQETEEAKPLHSQHFLALASTLLARRRERPRDGACQQELLLFCTHAMSEKGSKFGVSKNEPIKVDSPTRLAHIARASPF